MADLVSGLLTRLADEARTAEAASSGPWKTNVAVAPEAILRLVQAHRQITAMCERTKRLLDEANERVLQQVMDGTVATRQEQRDFDSLHIEEAVLQEVIEALAEGWGLKENSEEDA
jgi:hypothetical protein